MRYAPNYITSRRLLPGKLLPVTLFWLLMLIIGCTRDKTLYPAPTLKFVTLPGYISTDTTLMLNDTVRIGITATTGSNQPLTHLHLSVMLDSAGTSVDTALYTEHFEYSRRITKGLAKSETRIFYVRDRDGRKSDELTLTLRLDSASIFGGIRHIPSVTLGAQNNPSTGSFYSINADKTYTLTEAGASQGLINLVYYFDNIESDMNTIASPGANVDALVFPGVSGLTTWTVRNTTRFKYQGNISPDEFDLCRNDSLILSNTFEFESGFRKAKNLAAGQVYSFVTDGGYKGLFKVTDVQGTDAGLATIEIKIKK